MKSNKRFTAAAISFALAASMALPYAAGAQGATGTANQPDVAGFCKGLAAMATKVEGRLDEGSKTIASKRADALARLGGLKQEHEDKLKDLRSKEDEKRAERLTELETEADTDAERAALVKFQADVAAAVAARREATDAANETFRDGLKSLIAARKSAVDAATTTFTAAVHAALAKAKADCAAGVSPATVRQTLLAAMTDAREKFQTAMQDVAKIGPQVKALIETRKVAHANTMDTFHAALEQAKTELKTAFGA